MEQFNHNSLQKRRWYDDQTDMTHSVKLMEVLPGDMLEIVAHGVVQIAENEFDANKLIQSYKSLGPDKVMSLYKSKNKRRGYDQSASMHKMMNYMGVLSKENRAFITRQLQDMIAIVTDYLRGCRDTQSSPNSGEIGDITRAYVDLGPDQARELMKQLKKNMVEKVEAHLGYVRSVPAEAKKPEGKSSSSVIEGSEDMKIRFE